MEKQLGAKFGHQFEKLGGPEGPVLKFRTLVLVKKELICDLGGI